MAGKTDIGKLVISKSISKENYKNEPAHLAVARRMKARDPSYESGPAERIPFVIVSNGGKNVTQRAEDPLWAIKEQIPIDIDYYIQNQLAGPCSRILMWFFASAQDKHTVTTCEDHLRLLQEKIPDDFARLKSAKDELVKAIKMMQKHTVERFFGPGALIKFPRKIQSTAGKRGSIDSFFSKSGAKKRCSHGNEPSKCAQCNCNCCAKCGKVLEEDETICTVCEKVCPVCKRALLLPDGVCVPCSQNKCRGCLADLVGGGGFCNLCETRMHIRKRLRISRVNSTADIEDLVTQAAVAKLKCDKCRGYADETEIRCVQKDCNNLYLRATLETRIKNFVH
jgi:hypothetical protein